MGKLRPSWTGLAVLRGKTRQKIQVQGLPGLQSKFEVRLSNQVEPCLKEGKEGWGFISRKAFAQTHEANLSTKNK